MLYQFQQKAVPTRPHLIVAIVSSSVNFLASSGGDSKLYISANCIVSTTIQTRYRINFLYRTFTPLELGHGLPFDRHQSSTTTFLITGPRLRHFELRCDFEFLGGG